MLENIIERALYVGLLLSMMALFGVLAVLLAYPTLGLMKIAPVAGYVMMAAIEVAFIVKAIKERREGGIVFVIAGVIYALAIVLL